MADNVSITQGAGTTLATDEVGGVHYQIIKVAAGALDSIAIVSTTNPFPVRLYHGRTILEGVINTSVAGDNTLATPSTGNKIKLVSMTFICNSGNNIQFKSGTVGETGQSNKSGIMNFTANGGMDSHGRVDEWLFTTATNKSLVINLSSASQVSGWYTFVDEA